MKKIVVSSLLLLVSIFLNAQSEVNHPTIASLKVSYKAVPQSTVNDVPNTVPEIKSILQATVTLKPSVTISKIYFNILDFSTKAILYQVNYNSNSSTITNSDGIKLFQNTNGVIYISNGQVISLKPYVYEIQTEDSQHNLSTIYSKIQ